MNDPVVVGRVNGLFGTRGWVKVYSYTRPRDNLAAYAPWFLRTGDGWQEFDVREARRHRGTLIASLAGIDDRDLAAAWLRRDIAVDRAQLAPAAPGEYYWTELIGLEVVNLGGERLGAVSGLLETGAHDVLEVRGEREHLIPFVTDVYVIAVDVPGGEIRVDWHSED